MNNQQLVAALEALIYISGDKGISKEELCNFLKIDHEQLEQSILVLEQRYQQLESGLKLTFYGECYRLATKNDLADIIADYLQVHKVKQLSQSALETLAIIAYKQPITRIEIEEIRGISSEVIIRKLIAMDLIVEAGRLESPGRPILYKVTDTFLDVFKLISLAELPKIDALESNEEDFYQ